MDGTSSQENNTLILTAIKNHRDLKDLPVITTAMQKKLGEIIELAMQDPSYKNKL